MKKLVLPLILIVGMYFYWALPFQEATKVATVEQERIIPMTDQISEDYADAPEDIKNIARAIRSGVLSDTSLLQGYSAEALNRKYVSKNNQSFYLLNDTLIYDNYLMAEALVAAGADVSYNNSLMVFNALRMQHGPSVRPFPDYSPGVPFLKLYLENGGDPNVPYTRNNSYTSPLGYAHDNLNGVLTLLEHGADPWLRIKEPDGHTHRNYFDRMAGRTGGVSLAEILFRAANAGYFSGSSQEQVDIVFATLERYLREIEGSKSSIELGQKWRIQAIVEAILATADVIPRSKLARLMEDRAPDQYGGWWLRPDQLVTGDEFTDGDEITYGTLVWTHLDPVPRERPEE